MLKNSGRVILLSSIKTYKRNDVLLFNNEFFNGKYIDDFISRYYGCHDETHGLYKVHIAVGKKNIVVKS